MPTPFYSCDMLQPPPIPQCSIIVDEKWIDNRMDGYPLGFLGGGNTLLSNLFSSTETNEGHYAKS